MEELEELEDDRAEVARPEPITEPVTESARACTVVDTDIAQFAGITI